MKVSKNKSHIFNLYTASLFLYFLQSLYAWFLWGSIIKSAVLIIVALVCLLNRSKNRELYRANSYQALIGSLILVVLINSVVGESLLSWIRVFFQIVIFYDLLSLSNHTQKILFLKFAKVFGIISFVSLFGWLLFLVGMPLPHSIIVNEDYGYSFDNYYIFLYNAHLLYPRFCCVFFEPGQYAMVAVIFLHVFKFNLKNKYILSIFASVLFSLSLAGYIIMFISLAYHYLSLKNLWKFALLFFVLIQLEAYFSKKDYGDNAIYFDLFRRLEIENGDLTGNNRNADAYIQYFNKFINSSDVLFGDRGASMKKDWGHGNAGYRVYVVTNGLICTFFTLLVYLLMCARLNRLFRGTWMLFFIEFLLFLQAAYPFWFCVFSLYALGLPSLQRKNENTLLSARAVG